MPPALAHVSSRDFSAVIVCVGAGSRHEPPGQNGVAHLLEHAAFLGAGDRDYRAIRTAIDKLGGEVSAETGEEIILYWGSANEQRDFPECLDLVADLVLAPTFEPDSLRREVGTVIQEISGAGDDVFQTVVEGAKRLLWPDSPLGLPVGGSAKVLRGLDAATCRSYWRDSHATERMFILVVGTAAESKLARKRFQAQVLQAPVAPLPSQRERLGEGTQRFKSVPMSGRFVRLCFGLPGISWSDLRLPALDLVNGVLGRDETSHLWERIRGQGLAYNTESYVDCFSDTGWIGVLSDAPVDRAGEVVKVVCEEVATLPRRLTEDDLERARDSHIARIRNDEVAAPLEWAKYQALHGYFLGRVPSIAAVVRELEQVTFDQARAVAADLLRPDQLVLCAGGPRQALRDCEAAFA
ncbi:MAG TPA: pitrilysin family protein [Chloroflexota bacterium]